MPKSALRYRLNVAAIVRNPLNEILICERLDSRGSWQFPQGGVNEKETIEEALRREVREEIGLRSADFRVVERRGPYRYLFQNGKQKKGFDGQEQVYFLLQLDDPAVRIDLETHHPEFRAYRWIPTEAFRLDWLPSSKQAVYRQVFFDFFGVKLEQKAESY